MATPYITVEQLHEIFGEQDITNAVTETGINIQSVIDVNCHFIDSYLVGVCPIPPSQEAIEKLRFTAANLVRCSLYRDALSESMDTLRSKLIKGLEDIRDGKTTIPGAFSELPEVDDPDTPADETAMSGSKPRDWEWLL